MSEESRKKKSSASPMRNTHVVVEGRAVYSDCFNARAVDACRSGGLFTSSLVIGRNNDGHGGLQQTGLDSGLPHNVSEKYAQWRAAGAWTIEVAVPTRITTPACGWTIGNSPSHDGSRCARGHIRRRQACVWEGHHIKIESTGISTTKLILPVRPHKMSPAP